MKVATWNVNSLTARFARVEAWLATRNPDVVLIQETKQNDTKFPTKELADLVTRVPTTARVNGTASRFSPSSVSRTSRADSVTTIPRRASSPRRAATCAWCRATCPTDERSTTRTTCTNSSGSRSWRDLVAARDANQSIVVGGDFNVTPTDFDCYDPSLFIGATHVSEPEREALRALEATGLTDLTRALHPDEPSYSWWDYRNGSFHRGWGLRIDLLFVDEALLAKASASYVDRDERKGEKPSDHAPVIGEFSL